jgi:type VI secretion system protein ImpA
MSSPSHINLERLLAPIPGDNPCGKELRFEAAYTAIKKARQAGDRDALGGEGQEGAGPQWGEVVRLATEALSGSTKDLMIAAWLTEALIALHGFSGLRDGLVLLRRLLEDFWDGVYPLIDEGDIEPRAAPLVWMTDATSGAKLPNRVRDIPLTPGAASEYSWNYWKAGYPKPKGETEDPDAFARRKADAEEKKRRFDEALGQTPAAFLANLHEDILAAQEALKEFDRVSTDRFGDAGPGITAFRKALEECEVLVRGKVAPTPGEPAPPPDTLGSVTDSATPAAGTAPVGPIRSREDAFRRLRDVSDYLRRSEPQSPVPLLIDRAIAWGQMPFDQLLTEMIKDTTSRAQVGELLGIKASETNT